MAINIALLGLRRLVIAKFLLLFLTTVHSAPSEKPWDVLIFVQNWPKSVCDRWVERNSGNTCASYPKSHWTIHGIWPSKLGAYGPDNCDPSNPFQPQEVLSLKSELAEWWTPVEKHSKTTYFWEHEWTKHGTCASPTLSTEYQFFKQALDWMKNYEMSNVLQRAGISPGGQYTASDIMDGVRSVLGKSAQVICYVDNKRFSVLLEVRICFDKTLQLVDCETSVGYTNCNMSKMVHYPRN